MFRTSRMAAFLAAASLGGALGFAAYYQGWGGVAPSRLALDESAQNASRLEEKIMGSADAPITIIEYASLTCNHCAAFHAATLPLLKRDYIDTGKARLIYRDFPLDPWAVAAAMIARCMTAERYFPFLKILFDHQRSWILAKDRRAALFHLARQSGMTRGAFDACLQKKEMLKGLQAMRDHASRQLNVSSTPTFFIEGERLEGNEPYGKIRRILEKHLQ